MFCCKEEMQSHGRCCGEFGDAGTDSLAADWRHGDNTCERELVMVKTGSAAGGGKGARHAAVGVPLLLESSFAPGCRVDGCMDDLSSAGEYHRRHRVCKPHASAVKVVFQGQEQRFCQQCSRFHFLSEFDEGKRSCRKRLAGHNERRRRQPDFRVTASSNPTLLVEGTRSFKRSLAESERKGSENLEAQSRCSTGCFFNVHVEEQEKLRMGVVVSKEGCYLLQRPTKSGEESSSVSSDPMDEHMSSGDIVSFKKVAGLTGAHQGHAQTGVGDKTTRKYGKEQGPPSLTVLELGAGLVLPPLPIKRDGKIFYLKKWPQRKEERVQIGKFEGKMYSIKELSDKKAWQNDEYAAFLHCLWECPKVQPVWRWAGRQLSKLRGSKVTLEWKHAICGEKLGTWATMDALSVWKLLRGIILGQVWHARKAKVFSGLQWSSGEVIRATWVDLMMHAMKEWLEVLKAKGSVQCAEAHELWARFDNKWLVNSFAGKRTEWSMSWKDANEVLLD